jgi:hypothetical protein
MEIILFISRVSLLKKNHAYRRYDSELWVQQGGVGLVAGFVERMEKWVGE